MRARGSKIMSEAAVTADAYSESIFPNGKNGFSMTYDWGGTLAAALYLQCRNHEDEEFRNCNNASFPTAPGGSAGKDEYAVVDTIHVEYRVFVDFTSGSGAFNLYLNYGE